MRVVDRVVAWNDGGVDRRARVGHMWNSWRTAVNAVVGIAVGITGIAWTEHGGAALLFWAALVVAPLTLLTFVPRRPWTDRDAARCEAISAVAVFLVGSAMSLFWFWFGLWDQRVPQMAVAMAYVGVLTAFAAVAASSTPVFLAGGAAAIWHPLAFYLHGEDFPLLGILAVPLAGVLLLFHLDQRRNVLDQLRDRARYETLLAEVQTVLDAAPTPLLETHHGRIVRWNKAFADLVEWSPDELAGADSAELLGVPVEPMLARRSRIETQDGAGIDVEVSAVEVQDYPGRLVWSVEDVRARVQQERLMRRMAEHDELTGLPNRRGMAAAFTRAIGDESTVLALLLIDLDGFKEVNDALGHEIGDKVLVEVAQRIRSTLRQDDLVGRLGGDELLVAISEPGGADELEALGRRLVEVCSRPITVDGHTVRVGASIGIAVGTAAGGGRDVLAAADEAMYEVKRRGGQGIRFHASVRAAVFRSGRPRARAGTIADRRT